MKLTWWGTVSLEIEQDGRVYWVDPYLSRNERAFPKVDLCIDQIGKAEAIFITHGHFDHLFDTAQIASRTGATVYCSAEAAATLDRQGFSQNQIMVIDRDEWSGSIADAEATAHYSQHIRFDVPLILRTIWRTKLMVGGLRSLVKEYSGGQVLAWRLALGGRELLIFGSGGSSQEELAQLAQRPTDILCVPLQGHSRICDIALKYVDMLQPNVVIPVHQDDFHPPISVNVDIAPFCDGVRTRFPSVELIVPQVGEPLTL